MTKDELEFQRLNAIADMLGEPSGEIVRRAARSLREARAALGDPLRWPIQPEGIGLILTEALNIPEIAAKIAKAIQSGNY